MVFGKWFRITGTDTAHDNATVRTYGANYERHNHPVVTTLANKGRDEIR